LIVVVLILSMVLRPHRAGRDGEEANQTARHQ
jgi:hypothetical protein